MGLCQSQLKKLPVHQYYRNFETSTTSSLPSTGSNPYDCEDIYYRGQQPNFCESLTTDCNGDLLFFIIDDKIYNKNGVSNDYAKYGYSVPLYLHTNHWYSSADYDAKGTGNFTNTQISFTDVCSDYNIATGYTLNYHFGSEIVVIPIPEHESEYYIVYSVLKKASGGSWGPGDVYFRKLYYNISNDEITLSNPVCIIGNNYNGAPNIHLAASPLDSNGKQFLFVNYFSSIYTYDITTFYNLTTNPSPVTTAAIPVYSIEGDDAIREEMEVRVVTEPTGDFFYLAVPYISHENNPSENKIGFYKYNAQTAALIGSKHLMVSTIGDVRKIVKGLEFSQNCEYLFYTYEDQTNLKCLDLSFMETLGTIPSPQTLSLPTSEYASDFEKSHYELGYDNALYIINGRTGNLKRFSTPSNPTAGSWSDVSGCSNLSISATYTGTTGSSGHYILTDQIDGGSNYENYNLGFDLDASFTTSTSCVNNDLKILVNASTVYSVNEWKIQECSSYGLVFGPILETTNTQSNPYYLGSSSTLESGHYYLITHHVEDDYCNEKTETKKVWIILRKPYSGFTYEITCNNNLPAISTTGSGSYYIDSWELYSSTELGGLVSLLETQTGSSSALFTGLQKDQYYAVKHTVENCASSTTTQYINTLTTPVLPADFNFTYYPSSQTVLVNMDYPLINKDDVPNLNFLWRVDELDSNDDPISGNTMNNSSNWWGPAFYTDLNFPGYHYPNFSYTETSPAGTFLLNHKYRITRGTWSGCHDWDAYKWDFTGNTRGAIIHKQGKSDMEMPIDFQDGQYSQTFIEPNNNLTHNIKLYPNPANEAIFVEIADIEIKEIKIEIYGTLGNLLISKEINSKKEMISLSKLSSGIYHYKITQFGELISQDKLIISK